MNVENENRKIITRELIVIDGICNITLDSIWNLIDEVSSMRNGCYPEHMKLLNTVSNKIEKIIGAANELSEKAFEDF